MFVSLCPVVPHVSASKASEAAIWMLTPVYPINVAPSFRTRSIGDESVEEIESAESEESQGHTMGIVSGVGIRKECFEAAEMVADMGGFV